MKTLLILLALLSFQSPKSKYIVFFNANVEHQGAFLYDKNGKPVQPRQDRPERRYFNTSRGAHRFYDSMIVERNLKITYHGKIITKVWIDSIPRK